MSKIKCEICGEEIHSVLLHLRDKHPEFTLSAYKASYPEAPLLSERAEKMLKEKRENASNAKKLPLNAVFGFGKSKAGKNRNGDDILVQYFDETDSETSVYIPKVDNDYVFSTETLKNVIMGVEQNVPVLIWGTHGVGKSSLIEQICARTNRPAMFVSHKADLEDSHIVGGILANSEGTYFEPGPLALCMRLGITYVAEEFDAATPNINLSYQRVLEGKSLLIAHAPDEWRIVEPHPNFRFVATANTNGSGDETGIYSGTNIGNAANYSRFGITVQADYMPKKQEAAIVNGKTKCGKLVAEKLVEFASHVREKYQKAEITLPISTRELIYAGKVGGWKMNFEEGVMLAYANRLPASECLAIKEIAQRYLHGIIEQEQERVEPATATKEVEVDLFFDEGTKPTGLSTSGSSMTCKVPFPGGPAMFTSDEDFGR
jgi:cobaltochelatase CobS